MPKKAHLKRAELVKDKAVQEAILQQIRMHGSFSFSDSQIHKTANSIRIFAIPKKKKNEAKILQTIRKELWDELQVIFKERLESIYQLVLNMEDAFDQITDTSALLYELRQKHDSLLNETRIILGLEEL